MDLPSPPQAVTALAAFVRDRLAEMSGTVSETLSPLWGRRDGVEVLPARGRDAGGDHVVLAAARQLAMVLVGAAAPLATTSYSRARLIRQMHASGLLTDEHLIRTQRLLELAANDDAPGAPR
jgi:predicted NAD/FAD-binding protein